MTNWPVTIKAALLASAALLLLGAGLLAPTIAAQQPPDERERPGPRGMAAAMDQVLERVAQKLNIPADQLRSAFREAMQEIRQEHGPLLHGRPGRGPIGRPPMAMMRQGLQVAAATLGMQPEELLRALPGRSLADVARERGVDPQRVAQALVQQASQHIQQAASEGHIPEERARAMLERLPQMVERMMNREFPERSPGRSNGPGPRSHHD